MSSKIHKPKKQHKPVKNHRKSMGVDNVVGEGAEGEEPLAEEAVVVPPLVPRQGHGHLRYRRAI